MLVTVLEVLPGDVAAVRCQTSDVLVRLLRALGGLGNLTNIKDSATTQWPWDCDGANRLWRATDSYEANTS
jgi:YD repeat-containing protein